MNPHFSLRSPVRGGRAAANRHSAARPATRSGIADRRAAAVAQGVLPGKIEAGPPSLPVQRLLDLETAKKDIKKARIYAKEHFKKLKEEYVRVFPEGKLKATLNHAVIKYNNEKNDENLLELIKCLNEIEEEVLMHKEVGRRETVKDEAEILIGTEFTFTNKDIESLRLNEEYGEKEKQEREKQEKLAGTAAKYILKWADEVKKKVPKTLEMKSSHVKAKDNSSNAIKFEYFQADELFFYWVLDLDDGCLETQTQPTHFAKMNNALIGQIIQENIFDVGALLGLKPDEKIGGGHLSFDASSMVGKSAVLLLDLLDDLQDKSDYWQKIFDDKDEFNASWMREMVIKRKEEDALTEYRKLLAELRKKAYQSEIELPAVLEILRNFNLSVINKKIVELEKGGKLSREDRKTLENIKSAPNHYQAVNIEHLGEEGGASRLELRRIKAQTSYKEMLFQIEFILKEFIALSRFG